MKPGYLFRNFTSSCFTKQQLQGYSYSYSYSYSYRLLLLFSTQETTTSTSTRKPVAEYFRERLGLSEVESLSISKKLLRPRGTLPAKHVQSTDLISFEKSDIVITYLQEHCGLDLTHVKKLVSKYPVILRSNVDKTIQPKIELLQDLGFSNSDLAQVLSTNPALYLASDLSTAVQALRGILGSDDKCVVKALKGFKYGTASNILSNLIPNVNILENEYGIPRDKIRKFMTQKPIAIMVRTETSLRDVLVRIEDKWGISRDSTEFLRAVHVFCCVTDENINSKCQVFRSYGWSDSDILSLISRYPNCLSLSEATIKKKLDFFMKELGYEPAYIAYRRTLLGYSLENRVVPRYGVLSILKAKSLIIATYQLYKYLAMSEDRFFNRFVLPYEKILPNLRDVYINRRAPSEVLLLKEAHGNGS